jgi:arginine decarboxylase
MIKTPFTPFDVLHENKVLNSPVRRDTVLGEPLNMVFGCRIPKDYFETSGKGESDIAVHAGAYHLALKDAGIERCNIMTYSSILPCIANLIERPAQMVHGSVVECIMSVCNVEQNERGTAGITYGWLYNRKSGERYGGLVCENYGDYSAADLQDILQQSINELYINGFEEEYELRDIKYLHQTITPTRKYGTALVALCFTTYCQPIVSCIGINDAIMQ